MLCNIAIYKSMADFYNTVFVYITGDVRYRRTSQQPPIVEGLSTPKNVPDRSN